MLTVICSTEQIESMEYYLRSSGVADVFLRKNIQKQETEDGGAGKGTPYTADEVYFAVTGEKASKESIAEDFDYWYNKGEEITQGELADKYSLEELRMQAYSNASEACEKTIYAGIDVEISTGTEHFSLTEKDQLNLFGKKMQLLEERKSWNTTKTVSLVSISQPQICRKSLTGQCSMCPTTQPTAMRSTCGSSQQRKRVIWSRSSGELRFRKSSRTRF